MRLHRLAYATIALILAAPSGAHAEHIVAAGFVASLDTGSLNGTVFPVSFSYDADQITAQGDSYITLKTFDFTLGGVAFNRSYINQGGQVIFRNGVLQNVTASFQGTLPPNATVNNVTFGFGGDGIVGYVDRQGAYGLGSFQLVNAAGVLNAASFALNQAVSPGSLVSLFGSGFPFIRPASEAAPLPTAVGNFAVTIGGIAAPLLYVSATQINLQIPWAVPIGISRAAVTWNGMPLASFDISVDRFSPGIFTLQSGSGQAIALNQDGSFAAPPGSIPGVASRPAKPGDTLKILATGLGSVSPAIADGRLPSAPRTTNTKPEVWIGGIPAQVIFSGLSPEYAGVNQIDVVAPAIPTGIVPLQIETGGIRSAEKVTISVAAQ